MSRFKLILIVVSNLLIVSSFQAAAQEHKPYVGSPEFEQMKQLIGSWDGMIDMGEGPKKVTTTYKLTSGGSTIVETAFAGAPNEMMTVFHDDSQKHITMTHYCMLGNQPKMTLEKAEGNSLFFDLSKDSDIDVSHDHHMHGAKITFDSKDQMTQQWSKFETGKEQQMVKVIYNRIR